MLRSILIRSIVAALVALLATTCSWASEDAKCALRAGNFDTNPSRQFAGMFRTNLDPPDTGDFAASQRHVAFSTIWGHLIFGDIHDRSRGLCVALPTASFPDLRIFLAVNRSSSRIEREKTICAQLLQDVVTHSEPSEAAIERSIARYTAFAGLGRPADGDTAVGWAWDADNVSLVALQHIYQEGSPLHTVAMAGRSTLAVDKAELLAWIRRQRQSQRLLLEAIPHCLWPGGDLSKSTDVPAARVRSGILPPGGFSVSRSPAGPLPPGPLRYLVMLGDPAEPPGLAVLSEVQSKYCNRIHTFAFGEDSSEQHSVTVQPYCSRMSIGDLDVSNVIHCRPKDCSSESVERAVMTAIATDPEILDFARRSSNGPVPQGPYLVTIK